MKIVLTAWSHWVDISNRFKNTTSRYGDSSITITTYSQDELRHFQNIVNAFTLTTSMKKLCHHGFNIPAIL